MIYKYILSISGDGLYPERLFEHIQGKFVVASHFKPIDLKPVDNSEQYGYGSVSFWHPKKFSNEDNIAKYENDFIEFIGNNYPLFVENRAVEFEIFIEIYFDGGQCNFEIFNKELLNSLGRYRVSLPISIYVLKKREIQKWEKEIKLTWECR